MATIAPIYHYQFLFQLHIVHRKSSELKEEANDDSAGYAVVAVMLELTNDQETLPNQHLEQLIGVLPLATSPGEKCFIILSP